MTDDVWLVGSSYRNIMMPIENSMNDCGYQIDPLKLNGHYLLITGRGGDDVVQGPTNSSNSFLFGEDGRDRIIARTSGGVNVRTFGGEGNDTMFSRGNAAEMNGGNGNDLLCLNRSSSGTVSIARGEGGSDTRCGSALSMDFIENSNCNNACLEPF